MMYTQWFHYFYEWITSCMYGGTESPHRLVTGGKKWAWCVVTGDTLSHWASLPPIFKNEEPCELCLYLFQTVVCSLGCSIFRIHFEEQERRLGRPEAVMYSERSMKSTLCLYSQQLASYHRGQWVVPPPRPRPPSRVSLGASHREGERERKRLFWGSVFQNTEFGPPSAFKGLNQIWTLF